MENVTLLDSASLIVYSGVTMHSKKGDKMQCEMPMNRFGEGCQITWDSRDRSTEGGLFYDADGFVVTSNTGPSQMVTLSEIEQSADCPDQAKRWALRVVEDVQAAKVIAEHITESAFAACGAHDFRFGNWGLTFRIAHERWMTIGHNGNDLYDVRVCSSHDPYHLLADAYFIEADQLSEAVVRLGAR